MPKKIALTILIVLQNSKNNKKGLINHEHNQRPTNSNRYDTTTIR